MMAFREVGVVCPVKLEGKYVWDYDVFLLSCGRNFKIHVYSGDIFVGCSLF